MKTAPKADALEERARALKQVDDRIQVYLLPSDPEGPSQDTDLHVAVLANVEDERLMTLNEAIADIVEDINLKLNYRSIRGRSSHKSRRHACTVCVARWDAALKTS